jgi:predicted nucleotidyltransferase
MDVLNILKSHEKEVKRKFGVRKIGIFGSYARGEEKETSDVDVLVEFEEPTFRNFMGLVFFLEDLFDREVDLVTIKGLSPYIRPHVEREVVWSE